MIRINVKTEEVDFDVYVPARLAERRFVELALETGGAVSFPEGRAS